MEHDKISSEAPLVIRHLSKSFGEEHVICDLSLSLLPDHVYCLMGPSGTGKTTLLKLMMGLLTPDSGEILPEGLKFSAVFQEDRLLPGYTAEENIRFVTGKRYSEQELKEMILKLLPADSLKKPVAEFSGGMKRRTAILRAMLAESDVILMDEPFTGLDPETKKTVIEMIREQRGTRLLLVSTHDETDAGLLHATILRPDHLKKEELHHG